MSDSALLFALGAGASAAGYTVCIRFGSAGISPALGASLVSAVALLVNLGVVGALITVYIPQPPRWRDPRTRRERP